MPIPVKCPGCQAKLNAPDAAAGKSRDDHIHFFGNDWQDCVGRHARALNGMVGTNVSGSDSRSGSRAKAVTEHCLSENVFAHFLTVVFAVSFFFLSSFDHTSSCTTSFLTRRRFTAAT